MTKDSQYGTVSFQANKSLLIKLENRAEEEMTDKSTICRKAIKQYCGDGEE